MEQWERMDRSCSFCYLSDGEYISFRFNFKKTWTNDVNHNLLLSLVPQLNYQLMILLLYGQMWQEVWRNVEFMGLEYNLPRVIRWYCYPVLLLLNLQKKLKQWEDRFQSWQNDFKHLKLTLLKCRSLWRNIWLNLIVVKKRPTLMKSRLCSVCLDIFYEI